MKQTTSWNPDNYGKNARFVSDLGEPLLLLLEPRPREHILDLGCGDGALTAKIAALGAVVIGVDSSLAQIQAARQRGLNALVMDGHRMGFKRAFDGVFSNAVLHWMKPPERVIEAMSNLLRPGGRFVAEFGGKGNVQTIRSALHSALVKRGIDPWRIDPWYYPSPEEYAALLNQFGFTVQYIELIPRPTQLPGDIVDWLDMFAQPFINSLQESERDDFLQEVRDAVEPNLRKSDGMWFADYVRLRFKALARR